MNNHKSKAWLQYEAGVAYKRRIGLYENSRRNQAFYQGDQWRAGEGGDLPRPVFNLVRRVVDFLVCSVASTNLSIDFSDENLPFARESDARRTESLLKSLTQNTAYRWEKDGMDTKIFRILTDAAICGDGALFCYWDSSARGAGDYEGDIITEVADSAGIFPADVNKSDIQSQEYIILSGRQSVSSLKREAERNGVSYEEISAICRDDEGVSHTRQANLELEGEDEEKATFIIKFWREDGRVCFEKSTRSCVIKRARTDCRLYPIAFFNWSETKHSFHGASPVTPMIPNQKFINRAYAMAMKHMTDTAFSKVIYDKSRIPEWTNEVGEAIAAMGGGNISDAVSVIGTGEMQNGFCELIDSAVTLTKELMGATESALGNLEANNTSAILALQETSRITLDNVRYSFYKCIEDLANIWVDMICAYYPSDRLIPCAYEGGIKAVEISISDLRKAMIRSKINVSEITRFSAVHSQNMLDKLLDGGYISPAEYVRRLPSGLVASRASLINEIERYGASKNSAEVPNNG